MKATIGQGRRCGRKQPVWVRLSQDQARQTQHTSEQRVSTHSFLLAGDGVRPVGSSRRLVLHESPNTTSSVVWRLQTFFARVIGWYESKFHATNSRAEIASSTTTLRRAKSFILSFASVAQMGAWVGSVYTSEWLVVVLCLVSTSNQIDSVLAATALPCPHKQTNERKR